MASSIKKIPKTKNPKSTYDAASPVQTTDPTVISNEELSKRTGITYDRAEIEAILNKGVDTKYDTLYKEQANTENKYYDTLAENQSSLQNTLRQQQGSNMMSGISKGASAANQLSAMLGISQQGVQGATDLSNQRGLLADKKASDQAAVVGTAFDKSTANATTLAGLGEKYYSDDVTKLASQYEYNAAINQANASVAAQQYASDSAANQNYQTVVGNLLGAQAGADATRYSADQTAKGYANYGVAAARVNAANSGSNGGGYTTAGNTGSYTGGSNTTPSTSQKYTSNGEETRQSVKATGAPAKTLYSTYGDIAKMAVATGKNKITNTTSNAATPEKKTKAQVVKEAYAKQAQEQKANKK